MTQRVPVHVEYKYWMLGEPHLTLVTDAAFPFPSFDSDLVFGRHVTWGQLVTTGHWLLVSGWGKCREKEKEWIKGSVRRRGRDRGVRCGGEAEADVSSV